MRHTTTSGFTVKQAGMVVLCVSSALRRHQSQPVKQEVVLRLDSLFPCVETVRGGRHDRLIVQGADVADVLARVIEFGGVLDRGAAHGILLSVSLSSALRGSPRGPRRPCVVPWPEGGPSRGDGADASHRGSRGESRRSRAAGSPPSIASVRSG
ncbi:MAG: hypothetical protein RML45_04270 [Acetobacteraceae bacterium]|nr:hypothetical protein [Acetobacteraceae bacterium]